MIRVFHVLSSLGAGGVEAMLCSYYENINRAEIQFDYAVHGKDIGMLEADDEKYGARVFRSWNTK